MRRRDALKTMAGLAALGVVGQPALGLQSSPTDDSSLPELMRAVLPTMGNAPVAVSNLRTGLSLITGPGGNIAALVGPDGVVLIDSFVPAGSAGLLGAVRTLSAGPITLINTHWHFDHTGGNAALAASGAKILAHQNARKRLSTDQVMADYEMKIPASPPSSWPVTTINDEATLYLNGEEIHLAHVAPAHTDGDLVVHFRKANVIHTGDLFTNGAFPNIDSSSLGWVGGMVAAADHVLSLAGPSTTIIPGHGPVASVDDLKAFRAMLAEAQAQVEPLVLAGKSVQEAVAARPLASLEPRWGKGIFKASHFTRLVYSGLLQHHQAQKSK